MASTGKNFFGAYKEIDLPDVKGEPAFTSFHPRGYGFQIGGTINFGDSGTPAESTVTIANVSVENQSLFRKGDSIRVKAGSKDLFALLCQGTISRVGREIFDNSDRSITITFTEGVDFSKIKKINSAYNGSEKVKHTYKTTSGKTVVYYKTEEKKLNIAFKKGVKASTIIKRISRSANIPIAYFHLKKDKVYKKGYTLSAKPYNAIVSIAKECGSKVYRRRGDLCIDDWGKPNPYNEHILVSPTTGMIGHPEFEDDGSDSTMTVTTYLDPRISTGSVIDVEDDDMKINDLYRVKSGSHNLDDMTTTMEVYV